MASLVDVRLGAGRAAVQLAVGSGHNCVLLDDGRMCPLHPLDWLLQPCVHARPVAWREGGGWLRLCCPASRAPPDPTIPARSKCWGYNVFGQLGLGDTNERGGGANEMGANLPSVDLGANWTAVEVAVGNSHSCARLENGAARALKCWGRNAYGVPRPLRYWGGQLGLGDMDSRGDGGGEMGDSLPAVQLGTGRSAVALALGDYHSCALLDDASVKCWGHNSHGQLGLGDTLDRGCGQGGMGDNLPAVFLGAGRTVVQLVAAGAHTCALLDDGNLYAPPSCPPAGRVASAWLERATCGGGPDGPCSADVARGGRGVPPCVVEPWLQPCVTIRL